MSSYYLPDITGKNPDYRKVNIPCFLYAAGTQITFEDSPIFVSSLLMLMTDRTGTSLLKDVDWIVNPSDIDQTAMARAFLADSDFADTLVKSVTLISTKALKQRVALTFQEFYQTSPNRTFDDGRPFEFTPEVAKDLVTGLADARQQLARVASPVAPLDNTPPLLPFDINAELSGNIIADEERAVNTVAGSKVIRLSQGAFFADTLTLMYNGAKLDKTKDYLPIGLSPLTEQTTNKSGIYQYILLNGTFTGKVTASYHAVGGEVQISDINALYDLMISIKNFLSDGIFITSDTVVETPSFRAMSARLSVLENNMRSLLTGTPTYGDSTSSQSVIRPIAAQDANFHWYTIAKLYQVAGSPDVVLADQFKGRVYFPGAKVSVAFTADVNLNQTRQPVSFKTENLIFDPLYTLFSDVSVASPVFPMFRFVWNQTGPSFSGLMLQVGLPLLNLSDQMVVEDFSSTESCWLLDKTGQFITGNTTVSPSAPKDDGFTLPDGQSVWSSTSATSHAQVCVPQYTKGYLVYAGSMITLNQLTSQGSHANLFPVSLPSYFSTPAVTSLVVTMASTDGSIVYDVEISLPLSSAGTSSGRVSFTDSVKDLVTMSATLTKDSSGAIAISLSVMDSDFVVITAPANQLTDVVRYIRAKV